MEEGVIYEKKGLKYKLGRFGKVYYELDGEWKLSSLSPLEVTGDCKYGALGSDILRVCRDWTQQLEVVTRLDSNKYAIRKAADILINSDLLDVRKGKGIRGMVEYKAK